MRRVLVLLLMLLMCAYTLLAQSAASNPLLYHRVWAIVPVIGKGTRTDPKRPMFVPSPQERKAASEAAKRAQAAGKKIDPPAILSYTMQLSDDKRSALVEFVGLNPKSLAFITQSKAPGVKTFERGTATKQDIETEFKKAKKDFSLDKLTGSKVQ